MDSDILDNTFFLSILAALKGTPHARARYDDDIMDRINHRYTQSLLIMFSIIVTANQLVGDNIHCWVGAQYSDSWEEYTNQYCWIKGTYYLPLCARIPKEQESEKRTMVSYYQWVPLLLLGQALMFALPCVLWRTLSDRSGVSINSVVEEGWSFYESETAAERKETIKRMVRHFSRFLEAESYRAKGCTTNCTSLTARFLCWACGRHRGNYLSVLYIVIKILYLLHSVGQIFLLDLVLGYDFRFFGIYIAQSLLAGEAWAEPAFFPRVTMCDFLVRFLGNTQRYTVQCVLPINLFNEKIFIFFWFWYTLISLLNFLSLCLWTIRILCSQDHERYIRNHLRHSWYPAYDTPQAGALRAFTRDFLRADGIFVLRMIGHNVDGTSVNELIHALWRKYRGQDDTYRLEEIRPTTYD